DSSDNAVAEEDAQAEPFSAYLPHFPGSSLLFDGAWTVPAEHAAGEIVLGLQEVSQVDEPLRAAVLEIRDLRRVTVRSAAPAIQERYPTRITGAWIRSSSPASPDAKAEFAIASAALPREARQLLRQNAVDKGHLQVLALLIEEEVAHRRTGDGWVPIV